MLTSSTDHNMTHMLTFSANENMTHMLTYSTDQNITHDCPAGATCVLRSAVIICYLFESYADRCA